MPLFTETTQRWTKYQPKKGRKKKKNQWLEEESLISHAYSQTNKQANKSDENSHNNKTK